MRALHLPARTPWPQSGHEGPRLIFLITGALVVRTANRGTVNLLPGDLVHLAGPIEDFGVRAPGECRLIEVRVASDWLDAKARAIDAPSTHPRGDCPPNLKRMVMTGDGQSMFRDFAPLFREPGLWSATTPIAGFRFLCMDQTFIDWHPEVINNFVIVLSGALELEVGGEGGRIEIFREGDICLAADRTGEGHIDRTHGEVRVAILVIGDGDLWPHAG